MKLEKVTFKLNGTERSLSVGDLYGQLKPSETLIETLRERFGLTGAKLSCNDGACGCCTGRQCCRTILYYADGRRGWKEYRND